MTEQAELNLKYGQLFANQSESSKTKAETENGTSEEQNEIIDNQSHSNRTFEKDYGVNKIQQSENNTSGQSDISTQSSSCLPKENLKFVQNKIKPNLHTELTEMDRDNFHHWDATREIMEIIRRRNNSPETSSVVEQRSTLSKPGTLRRRYYHQTQRTVFVPTRPNKRSREEITEIDAELLRRANRLGGGYHPINLEEETEEIREEGEVETAETEEDSVIMRGDNLPIVDLSKYNTDGKEAKYIQINHIVGKLTANKKVTEDHKESRVRLYDGPKNDDSEDRHRSGTDPSQNQHAERRPRNNSGRISDSFRQAVN